MVELFSGYQNLNSGVSGYTMEEFLAVNGRNPAHPVFKAGAWLGDMMNVPDSGTFVFTLVTGP